LIVGSGGVRSISKEEFLRLFPSAVESGKLAAGLLEAAYRERNADDLDCALLIGFTFQFSYEQSDMLRRLAEADWHFFHEDIIRALDKLRLHDQMTVDTFYKATQFIPGYLDYDEARVLAVKAIWGLGNMATEAANDKLRILAESGEPILSDEAVKQLHRQGVPVDLPQELGNLTEE
jgi:hypothetical protein